MIVKRLSIHHTVHDLNSGTANHNEWRAYISEQVEQSTNGAEQAVLEAYRILTNESRYKRANIEHQKWVKADRIVYAVLFAATIIACLIWNL